MTSKKRDKKSEVTREYEYLKVGEKYFRPDREGEKLHYIECTQKEFEDRVGLLKNIAAKMKDGLDREAVLVEALSKLDDEYLEMLWGKLSNPIKKPAIRTRKHHCVDMRVGNLTVPIVS